MLPATTAPPVQPTIIINGDFEQGFEVGWTEVSSLDLGMITEFGVKLPDANSGTYAAWLGSEDNEVAELSQTVTLPDIANSIEPAITLRFYYQNDSFDACGKDRAEVRIFPVGASTRAEPLAVAPIDENGMSFWQPESEHVATPMRELAFVGMLTPIAGTEYVNQVTAGVLLFRLLTWLLMIPAGGAAIGLWQLGLQRSARAEAAA